MTARKSALESPENLRRNYAALKRLRIPTSGQRSGNLAKETRRESKRRNIVSKHPMCVDIQPQEASLPKGNNNLATRNWFHSLPSQRFQALLTLFPKSFSSFPHGTCLLSVSDLYLALDDKYRPFSAPLPKYATLCSYTVRQALPQNGTLTLHGS